MHFEVSTLEPQIRQILSAPGTDLKTISAKSVRKQLLEIGPGLTAEFLRENKKDVDGVIASVFDEVSTTATAGRVEGREDHHTPRERETSEEMDVDEGMGQDTEEDDAVATLPPPRVKKSIKSERELSDAELARQLSSEINSRTRRNAGGKTRGSMNGSTKKAARKLKSAAIVDTDDDDNDDDDSTMESGKKKAKPKKKAGGGSAKGGFAKEYVLSEPLAAVLNVDKLSRPQVVKQLWVYIKGNELQNPRNRREILCDGAFKAIFKVDKIDMFEMNRVLGQHLHEHEG